MKMRPKNTIKLKNGSTIKFSGNKKDKFRGVTTKYFREFACEDGIVGCKGHLTNEEMQRRFGPFKVLKDGRIKKLRYRPNE